MDWIVKQTQSIVNTCSQLLTTKLFEFSGKPFSLSTLVQLIFFILIALVFARTISEWMKRQLLVRFKFDRGSREEIASVTHYILAILGFFIVLQSAGINLSSLFELLVWIDDPPETDLITSTLNFLIEAEFCDRSIAIAIATLHEGEFFGEISVLMGTTRSSPDSRRLNFV